MPNSPLSWIWHSRSIYHSGKHASRRSRAETSLGKLLAAVAAFIGLLAPGSLGAETSPPSAAANSTSNVPTEYRSQHLIVHTDLPPSEAAKLVARLETTLKHASQYWGTAPRGRITCYVVDDLANWSDEALPHRLGRVIIGGVGGAALLSKSGAGRGARNVATVYASSREGVAEHEMVHAYCLQTFGALGPHWYKEGMAEMVVRGATRESGVRCSAEQVQQLRDGGNRTLRDVVRAGNFGDRISQSMRSMLANPKNDDRSIPLSDWKTSDADNVRRARDENLQSWAFCYLLLHNPNYSSRFRTLGCGYVTNRPDAFGNLFGAMREEIAFEYAFFLEHVDVGYRVDLCHWDWNKRFRPLESGRCSVSRVAAARGYQASGLQVTAGERYSYSSEGTWSLSQAAGATDADGRPDGCGRLMAAVLNDFKLSEPIPLGVRGTFQAPSDGKLYLRRGGAWNGLHENTGEMIVKFSR